MKSPDKKVDEQGLRYISPIRAWLLRILGPADTWDNPLVGTKYDPVVKQHRELERQAERCAHHEQHRHGREEHGVTDAPENPEHNTSDH
jgi:hypothetical protein